MQNVRKTVRGYFWEIQFDELEAVPEAGWYIFYMQFVKGPPRRNVRRRGERRKEKRDEHRKKCKANLGKPTGERTRVARKKKRKNEREVARSPLFSADSP